MRGACSQPLLLHIDRSPDKLGQTDQEEGGSRGKVPSRLSAQLSLGPVPGLISPSNMNLIRRSSLFLASWECTGQDLFLQLIRSLPKLPLVLEDYSLFWESLLSVKHCDTSRHQSTQTQNVPLAPPPYRGRHPGYWLAKTWCTKLLMTSMFVNLMFSELVNQLL